MALVLTLSAAACVLPGGTADAKGPLRFEICGENGCLSKKSMRFTAAMLYGGELHVGPRCSASVHTATAFMPGPYRDRRYLLDASRGLVGEQGEGGYVWWRKVGGTRKRDLAHAAARTGDGFPAGTELWLTLGLDAVADRWRLRGDRVSCAAGAVRGDLGASRI